jgi:hypothetical protein
MLMNGELRLNTTGTQAQIRTSCGGGVRSSPSIAMNEPKFSVSRLARPKSRLEDSRTFKAYRACKGSRFTVHTAIPTGYRRLTHVGLLFVVLVYQTDLRSGFNQIDLPQYSSYEMLRQQLLLAIIEGGEGFAFS